MKHLAILSFILGVLVTSVPAQAQSGLELKSRPPVLMVSFSINR